MKKAGIFIYFLFGILYVVYVICAAIREEAEREPYIYPLENIYSSKWGYHYNADFFVYTNFKDKHLYIKYLFDFVGEHEGSLYILTRERDVRFDRTAYFINYESKHHFFTFSRHDSISLFNEFIRVNRRSKSVEIAFQIEETLHDGNITGKKLKADFKEVNVNIIQQFLDYSIDHDHTARTSFYNYIYELYDQSDNLILRQVYTDYGKYFTIEMYE